MTNPTRPHLAALTSARFFAAFHILLFHLGAMKGLTRMPIWLQTFASIGYVSVTFFFVLSGFILVYTYAGRDFDLRQFWRARLARVYPVYLLSLLLNAPFFFYAVLKMNIPQFAWFGHHLVATAALVLSMLQAWVPQAALGWSMPNWAVSAEISFYVFFPALLARLSRISNRGLWSIGVVCWLMAMASSAAYVVFSPDHMAATPEYLDLFWLNLLKFNPLVRLPEFVMGLVCGYWFLQGEHNPKRATLLVLGGIALVLTTTAFSNRIPYPILHNGLLAPAFAAIVCGLALQPRWTSFLESKWLVLLGGSSYALYLLHALIIGMFLFPHPEQSSTPGRLIAAILTCVVVAVLTFRFVEEPARKWLRGKDPKARAAAGLG